MYGKGHEPKTVEEFKQRFSNDYYPYSPKCWLTSYKSCLIAKTKNLLDISKTTIINKVILGLVHSYDNVSSVHNIRGNFTGVPYDSFNIAATSDTSLYDKNYIINIVDISGNTIPNDFRAYGLRSIDTSGQMAIIANWVTGTFYDISFRLTVSVDPMTEYVPYQHL